MEQKLNKLLEMLINTLERTGDLIGDQVPKFFEEIINYELLYSGIFTVFWLLLFTFCFGTWFLTGLKAVPRIMKDEPMNTCIGCFLFFSLGMVVVGMPLQHNARDLIKIKTAPRVYTLEYLRDFSRGKK